MTAPSVIQRSKFSSLPWPLIGLAGLCFTLLLFLFQLGFFFSPGLLKAGANLLEHLYILIWLLLVTAFNRTLSLRMLVVFWFLGLYPVLALALLAGWPAAAVLGEHSQFLSAVWVPLVEEFIKALPVLLYLGWVARRNRWQTAATDGLLLGFMVGAAFAFHEDAMARRVSGSGWLASAWSIFWPTLSVSGSLFQTSQLILGHAGWTALVGLGLGLAFLYRRYRRAWLAPLLAFGLATLDHGLSNYFSDLGRHAAPLPISLFYTLLLRGRLPLIVLLVGLAAAIVLEQRMLRWASVRDRLCPPIPLSALLSEIRWPLSWPGLYHLQAMREYQRHRRAAHYTLWVWRRGQVDSAGGATMAATLSALGTDAGLSLDHNLDRTSPAADPEPTEAMGRSQPPQ